MNSGLRLTAKQMDFVPRFIWARASCGPWVMVLPLFCDLPGGWGTPPCMAVVGGAGDTPHRQRGLQWRTWGSPAAGIALLQGWWAGRSDGI